jgi:acyl dehydratase
MQFGRCFEEFEIGDSYKHWPGRTITEYDDTLFCMLTMNHNPLHIDAHYTEDTQFGQRLVAGPLIFSIVLGMSVPDVSGKAIANLEFEYVRHLAPTFHGDTIYAETTVLAKKLSQSKPDRGIVTVETIAYNQRGENVLSFKRRVMVPTKEHDAARQRAWDEKMARARATGEKGSGKEV